MFRFTFLRLGLIVLATRCVWAFTSPAQSVGVAQGRAAFLHLPTQNVPQSSYRNIRTSFMAITWKDIEKLKSNEASNIEFSEGQESYDSLLFVFAIVPPVLAFLFQDEIAKSVAYFLGYFGFQGKNVDGNAFANNLLRPTINGVVVPATSIVLGTLFATTVNVLWNRQLQLRAYINKEVGELRLLRRALFGCFGTAQHCKRRAAALGLLHSYTRTLIAETEVECLDRLRHIQLNGGISMNELDELADMLHGVDGAAASRQGSVATAGGLLVSLNQHRSERVATTLSVFPRIHWGVLLALFGSINVAFLIESNQEVLQYLNSIQVCRICSILSIMIAYLFRGQFLLTDFHFCTRS